MVIYANATVLGGETVIGEDSIIGGNVWITESLPANSVVFHKGQVTIKQKYPTEEPLIILYKIDSCIKSLPKIFWKGFLIF